MFSFPMRFLLVILLSVNGSTSKPEETWISRFISDEQDATMNTGSLILAKQNRRFHAIAFSNKDDSYRSSSASDGGEFENARIYNEINLRNQKRSLQAVQPMVMTASINDSVSRPNESTINEHEVVSSEQDDMLHSIVTPKDEDSVNEIEDSSKVQTSTSTLKFATAAVPRTEKSGSSGIDTSLPSFIFPDNKDVKSIANASKDVVEKLNETIYDSIDIDTDDTSNSGHVTENVVETKESAKKSNEEVFNEKIEENSNSSSIIAIITCFTLVGLIAMVYFGVMAWKRYLRNHYWNRQLLVTNAEMDHDLHHFEL